MLKQTGNGGSWVTGWCTVYVDVPLPATAWGTQDREKDCNRLNVWLPLNSRAAALAPTWRLASAGGPLGGDWIRTAEPLLAPDLRLPASGTVRNELLLFTGCPACGAITAAPADED